LEPFGPSEDNWRAGMVASVIANVNRGKGTKAMTAEDFMKRLPLTLQEQAAKLRKGLSHLVQKDGG
jgi:hypothetical protein